jgi:hypothetical protein
MNFRPLLLTVSSLILCAAVSTGLTNYWPEFSHVWAQSKQGRSRSIRRTSLPPPKHADVSRVLAVTYYNFDEKLTATLTLSNQGPHPMEVGVTLFNLAGERLDAPTVMLQGETAYDFDLREWAESSGASFQQGSLQVHYVGMHNELGGVVKLVDAEHSLIFDEELTELLPGSGASRLEGVWWLRSRKSELHVAISNTTERVVTATIVATGGHLDAEENGHEQDTGGGGAAQPETLVLAAHETRVLDVKTLVGRTGEGNSVPRIGGISVTHSGPKGGVLTRGFIQEPATGFSNVVEFRDPQAAKTWKLNGAGLRIGTVAGEGLTQVAVARNVGNTPSVLTGHVAYALEDGTEGTVDLPEIDLAPGETRAIPLAKAIQASGISGTAIGGLEFEYSGVPGDVEMSALSVSSSGNQVFRVPMIDATSTNSAGMYPWSIDDTSSSFVYIKNVADAPQRYTISIRFDGGSYSIGMRTIEPHQTATFDLRKLRDSKAPDIYGKILPAEATHGKVHWSIYGSHNWQLIGRVEQADFAKGMSMTAACTCCGDSLDTAWATPGSVTGPPGGSQTFTATEEDWNCFGGTDTFNVTPSWSSSNTGVATVNGSGQATAVGVGSAYINADWYSQTWYFDDNDQTCISQPIAAGCSATCDVTVAILLGGSGGTDITNTTQTVAIGQQVVLYAKYGGTQPTGQSWTIPGTAPNPPTAIKSFTISGNTGGPTPLTSPDMGQQQTTFYWTVPTSSNNTVTFGLTYKDNQNNTQTATAQANFTVQAPTNVQIQFIAHGTPNILNNGTASAQIQYGNPTGTPPGIQWQASATSPANPTGTYGWAQLIGTNSYYYNGGSTPCIGPTGLDNSFPLPVQGNTFTDNPQRPLPSTDTQFKWSWDATTFYMWKPSSTNSIWVPIAQREWQFVADLAQNTDTNVWTVQSDSSSFIGAPGIGYFPISWSSVALNNGGLNGCQ